MYIFCAIVVDLVSLKKYFFACTLVNFAAIASAQDRAVMLSII